MTFSFKGISCEVFGIHQKRPSRPIMGGREPRTMQVPGRPGTRLLGMDTAGITFNIDVGIDIPADPAALIRQIAEWLYSETEQPLEFSDEPGKVYQCVFVGESPIDAIMDGTLSFYAPEPFAESLTSQVTSIAKGSNIIENDGTAPAFPTFDMTLSGDATFLRVSAGDGGVLIGTPQEMGEEPQHYQVTLLDDDAGDLASWGTGQISPNGSVTGTMTADGMNRFVPATWGTATGWHGPGIRRALPSPATDFTLSARCGIGNLLDINGYFDGDGEVVARVALFVLDVNGDLLGRIEAQDIWSNDHCVRMYGCLGNAIKQSTVVPMPRTLFNDSNSLVLEMSRVGYLWTFGIGLGTVEKANSFGLSDFDEMVSDDVGFVEIWLASRTDQPNEVRPQWINVATVTLKEHIDTEGTTPYIFASGDTVSIENGRDRVLKNGVPFMEFVDPSTRFFGINGDTTIDIETDATAVSGEATIVKRWR